MNARIQLHARFSANSYGWMPWLFDQLGLPPDCRALELGCGPGDLWVENLTRLPGGWHLTLSDFSAGMVNKARANLAHSRHPFKFAIVDAQNIPFPSECFHAVIANHMLYHLPDRARALAEIVRVLKPGGSLYASTVGETHMKQTGELLNRFDPKRFPETAHFANPFTLENGAAQLVPWFSDVTVQRYEDALEVTEVAPLVAYILSGSARLSIDAPSEFARFVEREMAAHRGVIHITKDSGVFEAFRRAGV